LVLRSALLVALPWSVVPLDLQLVLQ
jgi:hypothetical protein